MIGDPKIPVWCDAEGCEWEEEYSLTTTARGWDDRDLRREILNDGWSFEGDKTYCPDHTRERKGGDNE